jgi:hypothetical protein
MSARYEWAHTSDGPRLVRPSELDELAPDGNEDWDWGLEFSTGSDGCMIYGSLDDLADLGDRIRALVAGARNIAISEGANGDRERTETADGLQMAIRGLLHGGPRYTQEVAAELRVRDDQMLREALKALRERGEITGSEPTGWALPRREATEPFGSLLGQERSDGGLMG